MESESDSDNTLTNKVIGRYKQGRTHKQGDRTLTNKVIGVTYLTRLWITIYTLTNKVIGALYIKPGVKQDITNI